MFFWDLFCLLSNDKIILQDNCEADMFMSSESRLDTGWDNHCYYWRWRQMHSEVTKQKHTNREFYFSKNICVGWSMTRRNVPCLNSAEFSTCLHGWWWMGAAWHVTRVTPARVTLTSDYFPRSQYTFVYLEVYRASNLNEFQGVVKIMEEKLDLSMV